MIPFLMIPKQAESAASPTASAMRPRRWRQDSLFPAHGRARNRGQLCSRISIPKNALLPIPLLILFILPQPHSSLSPANRQRVKQYSTPRCPLIRPRSPQPHSTTPQTLAPQHHSSPPSPPSHRSHRRHSRQTRRAPVPSCH